MGPRDDINRGRLAPSAGKGEASWFWAGVPVGLLFLLSTQLDTRWFFFLFGLSLMVLISLAFPNRKDFYLLCLVFSVPIGINLHIDLTTSTVYRSTHAFMVSVSHIPMAALLIIHLFNRRTLGPKRDSIFSRVIPLVGLMAACIGSLVFSEDRFFGLFDVYSLFTSAVLFVCVASVVEDLRDLRLSIMVLTLSVALQGVLARAQEWTGSSLGLEFFGSRPVMESPVGLSSISRASGTLLHPNSLALFFDLTLPLVFSLLFCPMRTSRKLSILAGFLLGMAGLFATLSRGGMAATLVALAIVFFVQMGKRAGLFKTGVATAAAAILAAFLLFGSPTSVQERFLKHDYGTSQGRLMLMKVTARLIRNLPLWGTGPNNFVSVAQRYDNTPEQIVTFWNAPVHNLFLFIAGEIGLPGLVFFCLFLLGVMLSPAPAIRSPDPFLSSAGLGLFACFVAFVLHCQVDYCSWTHFVPLWFMAGLAVSVGRIAAGFRPPAAVPGKAGGRETAGTPEYLHGPS